MGGLSRREFLRSSAAAAGLSLGGSLLAACTRMAGEPATTTIPLPRKDHPVTWPIFDDNPPIPRGMPVEKGATLKIYQWKEYLYGEVVDDFAKKYGVEVRVENYRTIQEGVEGIRGPYSDFDIFFPTVEVLGELVHSKVLLPLNHDYLPNIDNLWGTFTRNGAPFYDVGQRYSVPYTVYSTGIMWRTDMVPDNRSPAKIGYDALWSTDEDVVVLDDYREAIGMALLRAGVRDVNTSDPALITRAVNDLIRIPDAYVSADGVYESLPRGRVAMSQAWSGDVFAAPYYGREPSHYRTSQVIAYWGPKQGHGLVGNDLTSILTGGRNPVLAHAFVNHLLDFETAMKNFSWNGYQPPMRSLDERRMLQCGWKWGWIVCYLPHFSRGAFVTEEGFERSPMLLPLDPETDGLWQSEWQRFLKHAKSDH